MFHTASDMDWLYAVTEVKKMSELKKRRSPGNDKIPTDVIQAGSNTLRSDIQELFNCIWKRKELPEPWKELSVLTVQEYHRYHQQTKLYATLSPQD